MSRAVVKKEKWIAGCLLVPTSGGVPVVVDAQRCGTMAVRRLGAAGLDHPTAEGWAVFYMPTGLIVGLADTEKAAKKVALAFAPLLAKAVRDLTRALRDYRTLGTVPAALVEDVEGQGL